jgi:hypothetical protein
MTPTPNVDGLRYNTRFAGSKMSPEEAAAVGAVARRRNFHPPVNFPLVGKRPGYKAFQDTSTSHGGGRAVSIGDNP